MKEDVINGIKYCLDEDNLTAEVINNDYEGDIIIPQSVELNERTYRVTSIGEDAFNGCKSLTSIAIPEGVTSIGYNAFRGCESLTSITIPEGVTSIGEDAFNGCKSLTSIAIPEGVTSIGYSAFRGCESLTSITIPEGVTSIGEGGTFQECTSLKSVQWNAINCTIDKIDEESTGRYFPPFHGLSSVKNFTFGNNVKSIPACLCYCLSGLTSIIIPEGVTSIGKMAFKGCTSLKSIAIPDSVMIVEAGAFFKCSSLKIVAIPSSVMIIEKNAFPDCKTIRYRGTVEQCKRRKRYWDNAFFGATAYCSDGDVELY